MRIEIDDDGVGVLAAAGADLPGRDGQVILSHAVWVQRFSRDPAIVGRSIVLDGTYRTVVGVMPSEFRFPSARTQVWIPLHCDARSQTGYWAGDFMPVVVQLLPDATLEQARAELDVHQSGDVVCRVRVAVELSPAVGMSGRAPRTGRGGSGVSSRPATRG